MYIKHFKNILVTADWPRNRSSVNVGPLREIELWDDGSVPLPFRRSGYTSDVTCA